MNETEFLSRWEGEEPLYKAWGLFVAQEIERKLAPVLGQTAVGYFLKVPATPRTKSSSSLLDKAFYRNKSYENPYDDITDKVGVRYVVLLTKDIALISSIIEDPEFSALWSFSKDKDYEEERLAKPLEFTYQSVHYVLKAKAGLKLDGKGIPEGAACEVQIRTLLQHAHSELTHDTLYKPKTVAQPSVKRTVAKSMALIEATDEFFGQAMNALDEATAKHRAVMAILSDAYFKGIGVHPGKERSNQLVLDEFIDMLPVDFDARLSTFLNEKSYVFGKIQVQKGQRHFFNQAVVLLAYYLAEFAPAQVKQYWPIEANELSKVFSDLGKRFDG